MLLNTDFSELPKGKRLYLASDFHLTELCSERELAVLSWLDQIKSDAAGVVLVGDVFDFWFEYKHVVPKGTIRFLSKLTELSDRGVPLIIFTGNHDLWIKDYLPSQMNITVYSKPTSFVIEGKKVFIAHGDGLGPGSVKYKLLKKVFLNPLCRWAFRWLHPDIGVPLARYCSHLSKMQDVGLDNSFKGDEEKLLQYCNRKEETNNYDYYVFGHRHLSLNIELKTGSRYINLGEWVNERKFGVFDKTGLRLEQFKGDKSLKQ